MCRWQVCALLLSVVVAPWAASSKPLIAVGEFVGNGVSSKDAQILGDRLRSELAGTGAFRVMERDQMDEILKEQAFQQTGACNTSECLVQAGQLLGVDRIVVGSVGRLERNLYTVSVRILDVTTGEALFHVDKDYRGRVSDVLTKVIPEVALSLAEQAGNPKGAVQKKNSLLDLRDSNEYRTVTIGSLLWMAENLNFAADHSWCYDNDSENCRKYGRLYDWNAAYAACPDGWRLPNDAEWNALVASAGGPGKAGAGLKAKVGWGSNAGSTDAKGFSALPAGYYYASSFGGLNDYGRWWTAADADGPYAWYRGMESFNTQVAVDNANESSGFSVRCVRDVR